jgi:hypothetical protein
MTLFVAGVQQPGSLTRPIKKHAPLGTVGLRDAIVELVDAAHAAVSRRVNG